MDWLVIWRLLNAFLAAIALVWTVTDYRRRNISLTPRRRYLTWSLMLFLFAVVWGSIEQAVQNAPFGVRAGFTSAACIWTLTGLWIGRRDDEGWAQAQQYLSSRSEHSAK